MGGAEVFVHELARRIAPGRTLLVGPRMPGDAAFDRGQPYDAVRLPLRPSWRMRDAGVLWQVRGFARDALAAARPFAPDAVFTGQVYPTGAVGARVARALGVPLAVLGHGEELYQLRHGRGRLSPLRRLALRAILRRAAAAFGPSRFTGEQMVACGLAPDRFHVVHPGVALEEFRPPLDGTAVRARHGLVGRSLLLSCGRLVPRKGVDVVIRLLPEIARRVPNVAYLVVGDGPERAALERLARESGVGDRIVFAGEVERAELPHHFAAADVVVMAYRHRSLPDSLDLEGFGIVLAEAAAAGRPTVATRVGGTGDAVVDGETGCLVDEQDTRALIEAVVRLLSDPALRARLGAAGRARVERELNWDYAAARVRAVLDGLAAAGRGAPL